MVDLKDTKEREFDSSGSISSSSKDDDEDEEDDDEDDEGDEIQDWVLEMIKCKIQKLEIMWQRWLILVH